MRLIPFFLMVTLNVAAQPRNSFYITNREPLIVQPYTPLPLGDIKPHGFLRKMLELQRDGLTGHLDSIYELVCGPTNGWLGGTGDGWERGPYWLDGLVPLAYMLDDPRLKEKVEPWIEWSIRNQREDGYFGPIPMEEGTYDKIEGTQQGNREDWWPKMVMLKVLQQYYMATQDQRVLSLMQRYFRYQLSKLTDYPLGNWTFWGNRRGADNLAVIYWLYNITGDDFLLDLAELVHQQTYDWTSVYSGNMIRQLNPPPPLHCVNVAQGLKAPVIYYQQHPEQKYLDAVKTGLQSLRQVHGFVNGMYGGDEQLHGNDPTQGSELCSATEMMYSFESILPLTGDVYYADYLEKVAYNVLPTQHDDAFLRKQYFQQVNQVLITDEKRNFFNDDNARNVFGVLTGYPCCTTNMHQSWPKFIQNLFYATADDGIAALIYGPAEAEVVVKGNKRVRITEETGYPFGERINFTLSFDGKAQFPFHLRIPQWCEDYTLKINGEVIESQPENGILILTRIWQNGDQIELTLEMKVRTSYWVESSVGIERGPLVYALPVEAEWKTVQDQKRPHSFYEVYPRSNWNYGLIEDDIDSMDHAVEKETSIDLMPWNWENAPIKIQIDGCQIDSWKIYNHSAGKIPVRPRLTKERCEKARLTLIPYGSTTLRIAQFPVVTIVE
ncbi:MAG: glycoside hydrolase family 127 protein [Saprospiraceae bacterium]|nr:glycoside hydrolase family 127 protein [Saprospiraceae bacterium]